MESISSGSEINSSKEKAPSVFGDNFKEFVTKIIRVKWMVFKLLVFVTILLFILAIKLLRQIVYEFLNCMDYLTNLGEDDIDGKIVRLFESVKRVGRSFHSD